MLAQRSRKFAQLPLREKFLLIEATTLLGLARLALWFVPFRRIVSLLGNMRAESSVELTSAQAARAKQIGWAVGTMSRHSLWKYTCLAQAVAAQAMLKRRGVPSTLYLGVAKDDEENFTAHAWVRSGRAILTGAPGHDQYTVVAAFGDG